MKKNYLFFIITAMIITLGSCNRTEKTDEKKGFDLNNLDDSMEPAQDFYQFACGGWMKAHPIPDEYSRYGSFDKLAEDNQKQVHELIEELAAATETAEGVAKKIGNLYRIGMDSSKLEQDGVKPIRKMLDDVVNIVDKVKFQSVTPYFHRHGIYPFFLPYVGADEMNSSINIVNLYQSGLGMPDRDYYLSDEEGIQQIRAAYIGHLNKMFQLAGYPEEAARKFADDVMKIETALARASFSRVELRDPIRNYNKMSVKELQALVPAFDWQKYFTIIGLDSLTELNVCQVDFLKSVGKIYKESATDELKSYYLWNIIREAAPYLNHAMVNQDFEFYGKALSGTQGMRPRWKRVVNVVNTALGEAVGEMYVKKYFPSESKERMLTMVSNLQDALKERIQGLEWMSEPTKEKAIEKLAAFHVKIGYPDVWRDYTPLVIKNDSYWANIDRSNVFEFDYMIAKAGKPVDKNEWLMTPQTVNAYYNPTTNEICFPAGILQPPFFFSEGDDAINYGAIGVVIGHEMTHGFDDQGRMYDKDGNLNDWWTEEDADKFNIRAQALADYFDQIIVLEDIHANGQLTLGENIADQGGLVLSYAALQKALQGNPVGKIDGYTPEQRFFLSYANVWAGNIRDQEILLRTKSDPHSLGRWRVNGTLPHLQQFVDAFDIKEDSPMFLASDKRCLVW